MENLLTTLKVFRTSEYAKIPYFATEQSACFDISACLVNNELVTTYINLEKTVSIVKDNAIAINAGERVMLPTHLIFDIPEGYMLEVNPRSGIALKQGLSFINCTGIIDSDYVEPLYVLLTNHTERQVIVRDGDRIAQARLVKLESTNIQESSEAPSQKSSRNGGLGSTGVSS